MVKRRRARRLGLNGKYGRRRRAFVLNLYLAAAILPLYLLAWAVHAHAL